MLSARLQAVADRVKGPRHADIGSDHGHMPLFLAARLPQVIAVEKHSGPFERCLQAVQGTGVEVRFGDGLAPLRAGEVDSLSICGMGSLNIRDILQRGREKLPRQLVLQPMDNARPVRHWARHNGFHLRSEQWLEPYVVLEFRAASGADPAYADLPEEAEFFGPLLLANQEYLAQQKDWLESLGRADARLEFLRIQGLSRPDQY
ncbi:MAG: SAM-dependent methyltransferase [Candidatus Eremiobacteraeota bacterium]|nr:SAM-dependent methyltransferase [Candidatus Eremiobacteraeota bacterium]MCW5870759.1 SAM-dependent methyltransferase [Candidatus Eremiobacteraeota bacterium]